MKACGYCGGCLLRQASICEADLLPNHEYAFSVASNDLLMRSKAGETAMMTRNKEKSSARSALSMALVRGSAKSRRSRNHSEAGARYSWHRFGRRRDEPSIIDHSPFVSVGKNSSALCRMMLGCAGSSFPNEFRIRSLLRRWVSGCGLPALEQTSLRRLPQTTWLCSNHSCRH